jgi:hypothetical protein
MIIIRGIQLQGRIQGAHAPPLKLEKIWFFLRKIVIFHTKYPKHFRPPSARRNFFNCAPLTWNPRSAPELHLIGLHLFERALTVQWLRSLTFYHKTNTTDTSSRPDTQPQMLMFPDNYPRSEMSLVSSLWQ